MKRLSLLSLLLVCCLVSPAAAGLPRMINYQGVLTDDIGSVVPDGMYNCVFKLYDIEVGGDAVWSITRDVLVEKGIFNVALGSIQPLDLPFDAPLWLGIAVEGGEELSPRVQLMAVPYSMNSWGVTGITNFFPAEGNVGIGNPEPQERLDIDGGVRLGGTDGMNAGTIRWTGADFEGYDGAAWQSLTGGSGSLPAGTAGQTLRHNGSVWTPSDLLYNDGTHIGIGTTTPDHTLHVNGLARFDLPLGSIRLSTPGGYPGIIAYTDVGHRRDIVFADDLMYIAAGPSSAAPAATNGIILHENGQISIGASEPSEKLHIVDSGPTYVNIDAQAGYASGVVFAESGLARWRLMYHPSEGTIQFYREGVGAKMVIGNGGRVGIGTTILHGDAWLEVHSPNPTPGEAAIIGYSYFNQSPSFGGGIAVAGIHSDDGVGGTGVYGEATDGAPGIWDSQVGVYGYADDGYGVYSDGTLGAAGSIVAVAPTEDYGHRKVYSMQSAENWFEDFGEGRLSAGEARVEIDPVFAQTVNLGQAYHVFLTPLGDCGLYVAEKTARSFTVRAAGGKTADIAFDYRIVAKRKGFEGKRLESAKDPQEFRQRHQILHR